MKTCEPSFDAERLYAHASSVHCIDDDDDDDDDTNMFTTPHLTLFQHLYFAALFLTKVKSR